MTSTQIRRDALFRSERPVAGSRAGRAGARRDIFATAACMPPTLVPISAYYDQSGVASIVHVGWYEAGLQTGHSAISGLGTTVGTLSAANAGTSFNVLNPHAEYNAYFVTGAQPYSGTQLDGEVQIRVWSYEVTPAL